MSREEAVATATKVVHHLNGVFQDGVVVGAPSFHQGFYHAIGDTLGKSHTDECSHYRQTNLRHRLIVAHNDVEEGEIKRYPGEPRRKDERQLVDEQIVASIEEVEHLEIGEKT